jgi:hypothetical protein
MFAFKALAQIKRAGLLMHRHETSLIKNGSPPQKAKNGQLGEDHGIAKAKCGPQVNGKAKAAVLEFRAPQRRFSKGVSR